MISFIAKFVIFLALSGNPHLPDGPPSTNDYILVRDGYAVGWDPVRKNPAWVCYSYRPEYSDCAVKRGSWFKRDKELPNQISTSNAGFRHTGYDKGHNIPYKDSCDTEAKGRATFLLSNMSPQLPCFNRQIWKRLEAEVRAMAVTYGEIHVCTGPAYEDALLGMLDKRIWIPHSFWKVVTTDASQTAFILPHMCFSGESVYDFVVDVEDVEQLTGLKF